MLGAGTTFAGYVIERMLGRGGMGTVYLAGHPRLPRYIALKVLNPELFSDSEIRARFEREADLVARLDHPGVVTVFDRGVEGDQLWISMQYIDGVDASAVDTGALPRERAVQIIAETAAALDFAHAMGVLHRDVKPANILLARSSVGQERVYLGDFGIARLREDTAKLTQTGSFTATLAYASPEQLTGAPMDGRSDQYSLACTLYRLLSGVNPFDSPHPATVIQGHLLYSAPPIAARVPGFPAALDAVLARAMAKQPEHRFPTCAAFAEAARQALTGPAAVAPATVPHPPSIPPPSAPIVPTPRRPGRARAAWIAALAIFLVPAVALGVLAVVDRAQRTGEGPNPVAAAFPKMLPDKTFGDGFAGAHCNWLTARRTDPTLLADHPDFGDYTAFWECVDGADFQGRRPPTYRFYYYENPNEIAGVINGLPEHSRTSDLNGGESYTNFRLADSDTGVERMITVFEAGSDRDHVLMYTTSSRTVSDLDRDGMFAWWQTAPIT